MLGPTTPDPTMDTSRLDICRTVSLRVYTHIAIYVCQVLLVG